MVLVAAVTHVQWSLLSTYAMADTMLERCQGLLVVSTDGTYEDQCTDGSLARNPSRRHAPYTRRFKRCARFLRSSLHWGLAGTKSSIGIRVMTQNDHM